MVGVMKTSCSVASCDRPAYTRGWCKAHYKRWHKTGDVRADEPIGRYSEVANQRMSDRLTGIKRGPMSVENRAAISAAKKGRTNGLTGRRLSRQTKVKISAANKGSRNGQWRGDDVGYISMHERARQTVGGECVHCGTTERLEAALKADAIGPLKTTQMKIAGKPRDLRYSVNTDDYFALCVPCHRKYDNFGGNRWR